MRLGFCSKCQTGGHRLIDNEIVSHVPSWAGTMNRLSCPGGNPKFSYFSERKKILDFNVGKNEIKNPQFLRVKFIHPNIKGIIVLRIN